MDSSNTVVPEQATPPFPVFVITLIQREERRAHVAALQRSVPYPLTVFPAITPQSYAEVPSYDQRYRQHHFGYDLTLGELGCLLSHRSLWEECVRRNQTLCILEDDVELSADFSVILHQALAKESQWDILRFLAERWDRWRVPVLGLREDRILTHYPRPAMGTAAYLIQPQAARQLLRMTERIRIPVDQVMDRFWVHRMKLRVVEPYPVTITLSYPSAIAERGWQACHADRPRPWWRRLQRDARNGTERLLGILFSLPLLWLAWRFWCRTKFDSSSCPTDVPAGVFFQSTTSQQEKARIRRRRKLLPRTKIEEKPMATPASMGLSCTPQGRKTPAARGSKRML